MDRWEYKLVDLVKFSKFGQELPPVKLFAMLTSEMQEAGNDGWEAVGQISIYTRDAQQPIMLFKRKVSD
jgi:hypothetical protein